MSCDISVYGILDPQILRGRSLAELARQASDGGATILQYRAKQLDTRAMVEDVRVILAALKGTRVPLLVNDRVDVALAAGAAGVHLGREDMHPVDARRLLGPSAIIGATVKNEADLSALTGQPIDYACIGGVFATTHKVSPDPAVGLEGFRVLRTQAQRALGDIPVGAIAGIDASNAGSLIVIGADGVAVIGAMFAPEDVSGAARDLSYAVAQARLSL